jgi:hypothetical protein
MIKLQKAIIKDNKGEEQIVVCNVSNPEKPEVLMAFFNSWNSSLIAENVINLLVEKDRELIQPPSK